MGLLLAVLQNTRVQSYLANAGSSFLSEKLGVSVWIDKVQITSFFKIRLDDVYISDHHNNPMITAKEIFIDYPIFKPFISEYPISDIYIDSAFINIVQYKGDDILNINMLFQSDNDTIPSVEDLDTIARKPIEIGLDHIRIENTRFVYRVEEDSIVSLPYMDYQYLDISQINIEAEDIHIIDDSIMGNVLQLRAKDRCGVVLTNLDGHATVSSTHLIIQDAHLLTPRSKAHLDLKFTYPRWGAYLDFINEVVLEADVRPSQINMLDIGYFAPETSGMDNLFRLQGQVKGPIRNMRGKNLQLSYGESTTFRGDLQMTGLPNIYETFIKLKIRDFSTEYDDLQGLNLPNGEKLSSIPQEIEKLGDIRVKGNFTGFYNDFVSKIDLYSGIGFLATDLQFTNNKKEDIVYYKGDFSARNFQLGQFLELESYFGKINFDFKLRGKGLDLATVESQVTGRVDSLNFRGNELQTIFIDAFVKENQFEGAFHISDTLIKTDFRGLINFDSLHPVFDFDARLRHVKLAQLGLLAIDSTASLSTNIHMNFTGNEVDSFLGEIHIDSTEFNYQGEDYLMDSLYVVSRLDEDLEEAKSISISSDFINGGIEGVYNLAKFPQAFEKFSRNYMSEFELIDADKDELVREDFTFDFTISNTQILTELFVPQLSIKDSLKLKGFFSSDKQVIEVQTSSNELKINNIRFVSPTFNVYSNTDEIFAMAYVNELVLKEPSETDTLKLGLDQLLLNVRLNQDSAFFNINWYNLNTEELNKGKINGLAALKNTDKIDVFLQDAEVVIYDSLWKTTNNGHLTFINNDLVFDSLEFQSTHQSILINGVISDTLDESFLMRFKNFNVSAFNILTAQSGLAFEGFLTGNFELIDVYNNINFLANMKLVDFTLNEEHLGDAEIKSTWNTDQSVFLNINLEKQGSKGSFKPLYLEGFYYPEQKENQIDLDVSVHNLSINFLKPFLKEFVSEMEGRATGEIRLQGNIKKPDLSGRLDLARTQFRIKYLNTLYSLSGTLNLDNEMIGFNEVVLYDTVGNKAVLQGGLSHNRFRHFGVNLKVKPTNFVALNTSKGMNDLFYGKAIIDGEISINGPFDNVFLDIDATSKSGTNISIPINTTLGVSENSFIVFNNNNDTTKTIDEKQFKPRLSSFSLNMDLSITPEANVDISLPAQLGLIQAQGAGDLNMNLSRTGNFRMSGDYRVSNGVFFFKIRNLLNRRFVLNEGGTISWTGDPYNGTLGMTAKYTVKTSLNSLGLDQDSSYRNRVPVDCMIGLTGPIMNPNMKFRFDLPNSTEEVKQYVFTKIDTTNPSEMSQQMLSLLVLNTFSFTTGTGNSDLANTVGGTSLQIVANQVSNWLSQISKDVDIGINYRPGGDLTNEEVEVALSTQLFDERVTIDGNFGYQNVQNNSATTNTSSIVGDINVEVKITKDGRLRLKAFNRTNTVDLLDNTSPYTQGVGIFYRKEFNNIQELFQNQRRRERKKQEEEKNKGEFNAVKNEEDGETEIPK